MNLTKETIQKFDVQGPRYTSYPTAPNWTEDVSNEIYLNRLKAFGQSDKTLSLYIHIPFCETMCTFCACNVILRKDDPKYGDKYLKYLFKEMDMVTEAVGSKKLVKQLHWGGGTPTFLNEEQIECLYRKISDSFDLSADAEIAIEIEPRRISESKICLLKNLGFNRISMGVQDFDPKVQENINRIQPFEMIFEKTKICRELGFDSVNFDLIYGLPYQTPETFQKTMDQVIELKPDRIALYSFAYVPWLKKHQQKIDPDSLPSSDQKLEIFLNARDQFLKNDYQAIAMDHFALKTDEMAKAFNENCLYRNFMGYTVKPADEYIGLGVTSIGFLENTFVQTYKTINDYYELIDQGVLPVERGKTLTEDDQIRQWVIKEFICHFKVSKQEFQNCWAQNFDRYFHEETEHIQQCVDDELLEIQKNNLVVTELGKIFIRNICMGFDWYFRQKGAHQRFSRTV